MFLTEKKNSNGLYYLYLMDSSWDPAAKRTKIRIVESFGKVDDFKREKPAQYAELVEKYGNKKNRYQAEKEHALRKFIKDGEQASESLDLLSGVKYLMPQRIAHLVIRRLWTDTLQMPKFFDYLISYQSIAAEDSISDIALYFSMLKMVYPSSYLEGMEISPRFLGDPMSDTSMDDVYRCLHLLSDYKDSIMRHLNKRIDEEAPRKKSLLFFDCTNCYFETPYNDIYWNRRKAQRILRKLLRKEDNSLKDLSNKDLNQIIDNDPCLTARLEQIIDSFGEPVRMHGPSKEKRNDLPLVSIALVVDEHAIPIDFKVFPGNVAETSTMIDIVRALKEKHGISNAILIADSALNGTKNLSKLLDEKIGFSVAKSALSFSKDIRNSELNLGTFKPIKDEAGNDTSALYKIIDYHNVKYDPFERGQNGRCAKYAIDCKMMITFSEDRRKRDLAVLEENISRAVLAVDRHEQIQLATSGWKQFVLTGPSQQNDETNKGTKQDETDSGNQNGQNDSKGGSEKQVSAAANKPDAADSSKDTDTHDEQSAETHSDKNDKRQKKSKQGEKDKTKSKDKCSEKQIAAGPQIAVALNKESIEKRRKCAGFAGILFHEPPGSNMKLTASCVSSLYHQLVQIEECFKIMKSDFEIRPVYVREKQSIQGHVLLCIIALIMIRIIQRKMAKEGYSMTAQQLQKLLQELQLMALTLDGRHFIYMNTMEAHKRNCLSSADKPGKKTAEYDIRNKLLNILGCELDDISTLEQIRKGFKIKSLNRSEYQNALIKKYYCATAP